MGVESMNTNPKTERRRPSVLRPLSPVCARKSRFGREVGGHIFDVTILIPLGDAAAFIPTFCIKLSNPAIVGLAGGTYSTPGELLQLNR